MGRFFNIRERILPQILSMALLIIPAVCFAAEPIKTAQDWAKVKGAYFVDYEFSRVGVTEHGPGAIASIEFMSRPITDDDIRELAPLKPELYRLGLGQSKLTDQGVAWLSEIESLRSLTLGTTDFYTEMDGYPRLTDKALKDLVKLKNLHTLDLRNQYITDQGISQLKDLKHLAVLDLSDTQIKGNGFSKGFPELGTLYLSHTLVDDDGLKAIGQLKELYRLDIYATKITDRGLAYLSTAKDLRILELGETAVTDEGIAVLAAASSVKLDSLNLDRTALTDTSVTSLSRMKSLTSLSLVRTAITRKGIEKLQQALPETDINSNFAPEPLAD